MASKKFLPYVIPDICVIDEAANEEKSTKELVHCHMGTEVGIFYTQPLALCKVLIFVLQTEVSS